MHLLGNLIWLVFGGLFAALGYFAAGIALAVTIVGIPFALQSFKLGVAMLWPFGKQVAPNEHAGGALTTIFNVIWLLLFGWELALNHLFWGIVLGITIVGIPFAQQHFKLILLSLWPFGHEFRDAARKK